MQWEKRSRIFHLIFKKCPKSRDDMELKKNCPTAHHKYGMQWDNRSIIFQLIFEKCPKSRDDMELKKNCPLHSINMAYSGTKAAEFFNSFLKNDLSPEMIWN